jgi:hypothetical protein
MKLTFLVRIPTRYGAIIPPIVANVDPIPKTTPEYIPDISL